MNILKHTIKEDTYTIGKLRVKKGKIEICTRQKLGKLANRIKINIYSTKTPSIGEVLVNQRKWSKRFELNKPFK